MAHVLHQPFLDAVDACAAACNHCAGACLQEPDPAPMAACIALDIDCAALCQLTAATVARGGVSAKVLAKACGEVCTACAAECERHPMDHCQRCAAACTRCADACREFAAA